MRDLYKLKPFLFSLAHSSIGAYLEYGEKGINDQIEILLNNCLDNIYQQLEGKTIYINIYDINDNYNKKKK